MESYKRIIARGRVVAREAAATIVDEETGFIIESGHPQEGCLLLQSFDVEAAVDRELKAMEAESKPKPEPRMPLRTQRENELLRAARVYG